MLSFLFSNPFLSLDFSLLLCGAVFYFANDFNGDLSAWEVGKVTNMGQSKYTLSPPPSSRSVFFWLLHFLIFHFCACFNSTCMFEQCSIQCSSLFQSVSDERFQTIIVRWPMGSFVSTCLWSARDMEFFNNHRPFRMLCPR